jgi:alkaline phosphatase D
MDRRSFLRAGASGAGVAALGATGVACAPTPVGPTPTEVFSLGVASGLHSPTEVVLWTRVEPLIAPTVTQIVWEVADDPGFSTTVASGLAPVSAATDHTVKVLVGGLDPDRSYWYRFVAPGGQGSDMGRARTLPAVGSAVGSLKLAFSSCQSYASGYYQAWRHVAQQDVDAVLFLGDYIYESVLVAALGSVRKEPIAEARTLADYRARYRLYKSDRDLRAAHAAHPFVPIWDDHEVVNDWDTRIYTEDPQRFIDGQQAWFEYQPTWPISGSRIHRDLTWGNLGHIFMLDGRQYRDAHRDDTLFAGAAPLTAFETQVGRTMLGQAQRDWFTGGLSSAQAAGVTWKIVGNPVMIAPIRVKDLDTPEARAANPDLPKHAGLYTNTAFDSWDGFIWERDQVLGHLVDGGPGGSSIDNTVFVTGDYHSFWTAALTSDYDEDGAPVVAHEFAAGGISSAGGAFNEKFLYGTGSQVPADPAFEFIDLDNNGYGLLEATPSELSVTYYKNRSNSRVDPVPSARSVIPAGDPTITTTRF